MIVALATPKAVWFVMRASGLVALVLFTLSIGLGVIGVNRWNSRRWPRFITAALHRNLSLLAMCFLATHVLTAVLDSYIGLSFLGAIVPFQSTYRPLFVGLGVLAGDLLLAITATSLLRVRIGHRSWRLVHWFTWAMWPLAITHSLGSGTDAWSVVGLSLVLACIAFVGTALAWRLYSARTPGDGAVEFDLSQGSKAREVARAS